MRTSRERNVVIFGVVAVLMIVIWNALTPAADSGKRTVLLPAADAVHKADVARRTLKRLQTDEKDMAPRIDAMAYDVPSDNVVPKMLDSIHKIALKSGIEIEELKPVRATPVPPSGIMRVPVEVRLRSQFQPNVVKFLYMLEDPAAQLVVNKMSVTTPNAKIPSVDVTVEVDSFTRNTTKSSANNNE